MATITFQCSVCKRDIETLENKQGLDIVAKCIITKGCKGKLRRTSRNLDNVRESFPKFDSRYQNYAQRRAFYNHIQKTSSNDWFVQHDLGVPPAVSVFEKMFDGTYSEMAITDYSVHPIDQNTSSIHLNRHVSGIAQLVARSSIDTRPALVNADAATLQATTGGTFVFAIPKYLTKTTNPETGLPFDLDGVTVRVEVELQRPNEESIICFEKLVANADASPWSNWDEILVRKRRNFYTRTKNILDFATFGDSELKFTDIPEGTRLRFRKIEYGDGVFLDTIESEGLLMLLSNKPYTPSDKVKNRLIDVGDMVTPPDGYFVYKGGEFFVAEKFVERTYPLIEQAKATSAVVPEYVPLAPPVDDEVIVPEGPGIEA